MIGILDADSLLYAIGSIDTNILPSVILDRKLEKIRNFGNIDNFVIIIEGNRNFRNKHDTDYKKHRKSEKPVHYKALRNYLILNYNPIIASNVETDDVCAIAAKYCRDTNCEHIIVHIDKDLNQIQGKHLNYNTDIIYDIDEDTALYNLCKQLIKGDASDSKITGIRGYGEKKAEKILNNNSNLNLLTKVFNEYILIYGELGIDKFYTSYKILKLVDTYPRLTKKLKLLIDNLCNI